MDKIPLADATESKKIPKPAQPDRAAIQNYFMTLDPKTGVVPKERLMQVYNDLKSNPKKNRINHSNGQVHQPIWEVVHGQ